MASKSKKPAPKKHAPKPAAKKAAKPPAKPAAKHAPAKAAKVAKPVKPAKSPAPVKPAKASPIMEKPSKKTALRDSILKRKTAAKPIAFSLDEVRAIAKTVTSKTVAPFPAAGAKASAAKAAIAIEKVKPQHVKAASLADILGFNPKRGKPASSSSDENVPEKFKRYFKLLIDLRTHLTEGIERHSEETLKRSAKDDAGDLSSYGQHMADAGTDTFDRDFALSMVANEQEALSEIEAAIKRIHDGTYGICEATQKPIAKERLLAVPFTRYTAEAQKDLERNRHRSRTQAGLFGEMGEEGGKMMDDGGGDE
ncbi:MAG: TraR/DksA C4-type zinc finger protein [Opitutaceae bacterium]|nr:TraR/DksA C4-type zinc finger protein [Opitutaceae bacterium]